ncbi:unannotated protein [freshwater metagenome]|uniref:Unannotated protein n=1 Tax=freshwater metagenome TaxID=449393 RepID=A0A6J6DCP1_9ZZZZ
MHAQDLSCCAICVLLRNDLDQAIGLAQNLRTAICAELMLGNNHVIARCSSCFLARTCPCNLWAAIDSPRHTVVIHGNHGLTQYLLDGHDGFGIGNVCKLWRINKVTNSKHLRHRCAAVLVDFDKPAIAHCHRCLCKSKLISKWSTTNGDNDCVDLK